MEQMFLEQFINGTFEDNKIVYASKTVPSLIIFLGMFTFI